MITLVLGGNKSGKSDFALELLEQGETPALFVATGKPGDADFRQQIADHQLSRGPGLEVLEVDVDLPQRLLQAKKRFPSVLVDSLDYWLFAIRDQGREADYVKEFKEILDEWRETDLILVSSEVGLGPLPAGSAVRAFVRSLGALNREIARQADQVYLVAAGLPLTLKKA